MTEAPSDCVVDASVVIQAFVVEPLSEAARNLLDVGAEPARRLFAPDLLYVECANILWKRVSRYGMASADAQRSIRDLLALAMDVTPTEALARESLDVALDVGITAYDACYVALARRYDVPLITADQVLVRKSAGRYDVRWLGP